MHNFIEIAENFFSPNYLRRLILAAQAIDFLPIFKDNIMWNVKILTKGIPCISFETKRRK